MHVHEEVTGVVYENKDSETSFLQVHPYKGQELVRENGKVTGMGAGATAEVNSSFTSKDGTFKGSPKAGFHTHPGHPDAIASLGTPKPSGSDLMAAVSNNAVRKVSIPYYIYAQKKITEKGVTSNVGVYRSHPNGKLEWGLRKQGWR